MANATVKSPGPQLSWQDISSGEIHLNFHPGQMRAWKSDARIVMMLGGNQSGKTRFGPYWMAREIQRRGPGDYLIASPTFQLMSTTLFPEFLRLFKNQCRWGEFTGKGSNYRPRFLFSPYGERAVFGGLQTVPTQIFFGHAGQPESLESVTAKAVWLDEAGQTGFKVDSWYAVNRRTHVHKARVLISTTPYALGWLRDLIYEPWRKALMNANTTHPDIDVIQFKSIENPAFSREEYDKARETMPGWKFRMFYDGEFERPAGAIYDCFDTAKHVTVPFAVPDSWDRYEGIDFGGVHTAGVYLAAERTSGGAETGRLFLYREYPARCAWASMSAKDHARLMKAGEVKLPKAVGGSGSEDQWREEFRIGGLPVTESPIKDVEVGIDRVYATIKKDELLVFSDCAGTIDNLQSYSRALDDKGNPTDKIADKESYHHADALRYIISYIKGKKLEFWIR